MALAAGASAILQSESLVVGDFNTVWSVSEVVVDSAVSSLESLAIGDFVWSLLVLCIGGGGYTLLWVHICNLP